MKQAEQAGSRRRRYLFAALALLLGFSLFLAALEAGLRLWTPPWLEQRMRELNAGDDQGQSRGTDQAWPIEFDGQAFLRFEPGSSFTVSHYEYRHTATIDELGGRVTRFEPGYRRVLPFMGDSFTFGVGVEDGETFVSRIAEAWLEEESTRLLNLGVTGTALPNQLDTLELRHEELGRPKRYVFSVFLGNDLTNIRRHYQRSALDGSARQGKRSHRWLWRTNVLVYHHPALKRLYAIQFLRQKLLIAMNRGTTGFMDPVFLAMRTDQSYLADSLVFLRRELERLVEVSSRLGFDFVLILIPDVHQLDAGRLTGKAESLGLRPEALDARQITQAVTRTLDDFRIRYLDIGPCLSNSAIDELYYTQDTHFTAAGHARAAECILEFGILDRSLAPTTGHAP